MDPAFTNRIDFQFLKEPTMNAIKKFIRDEEGVTAIEYGLLAALIATVIITAVTSVGTKLAAMFQAIADAL